MYLNDKKWFGLHCLVNIRGWNGYEIVEHKGLILDCIQIQIWWSKWSSFILHIDDEICSDLMIVKAILSDFLEQMIQLIWIIEAEVITIESNEAILHLLQQYMK